MMEQPSCKEDNAEEKKAVSLDNTRKDPDPSHVHDPDPKTGVIADFNANNNIDVDLNEKKTNSAEEKNKPSAGVLKTKKSVRWSQELVMESPVPRDYDHGSGYVNYPSAHSNNSSSFNFRDSIGSVKDVLGRWGKKVGETTRKAEDLVGNTWQHLKTSPSLADAALGRIAQGTKILAEGGYEKVFRQTFESVPEEQLKDSYACYLSTSAGPVMGVLYVSTAKLAFCSDNPLSYKGDDHMEWSYYKVVIPLHQLKAINPSSSRTNPAEKYIQIISADNHEFWFMGFLNYTGAVNCLQESLQARDVHNVGCFIQVPT